MLTSHPADARYFGSRSKARAAAKSSEKVIKLGTFAGGSFGVYPPLRRNGLYVGQKVGLGGTGPIPHVTVWMVTAK